MSEYYQYKDYNDYLLSQVKRAKRTRHATRKNIYRREWIYNRMLELNVFGKSVLCIGARDPSEMDFFRDRGFEVEGIDLYDYRGIIKCDMSKIYEHQVLKEKKFDIIYSNEAMEHCLDLEGFIKGLNLVCKKYFVCFCPKTVVDNWDCSLHSFMERVEDTKLYKEGLEQCFIEFDIVINEFYLKKHRLFFILKKKEIKD